MGPLLSIEKNKVEGKTRITKELSHTRLWKQFCNLFHFVSSIISFHFIIMVLVCRSPTYHNSKQY